MEVLDRPKLTHLNIGKRNKILKVEGSTGSKMPIHTCSHEAIILVQQGEALLQMSDGEKILKTEDSFIIPAQKEHALKIKKNFRALVVMAVNAEINFI
ncbi:cupin domain-containing protein [Maribacter aurantiacus]|uniref:Cupin domain-containing protein n=1 Tax=Maribacter aurantiacus TaxID=1882343 RepID=A0A5R8M9N6_9FLAO|nr:cupin domain-containing protein [Maribacter aurantiacus]TLF46256.1 cupin domain-containing protein [Maribacter aurantiacus]